MVNKNIKIENEEELKVAEQEIYALERQSKLLNTIHPSYKMSLTVMIIVGIFLIFFGPTNYSYVGIGLLVIVALIFLLLHQVRKQNQDIIEKNGKEIEHLKTAIKAFKKNK